MKNCPSNRGFTLLEVLLAIALLGLALVYLLQGQSRAMQMATKGRAIVIATELARKKIIDCKADLLKKGFSITDYEDDGDFSDDGFPNISWECHGTRFDMPAPSPDQISQGIKSQGGANQSQASDMQAAVFAPFFSLVANSLGDSARELVTIVRWKVGEESEEMKLTTHVVDPTPLARAFAAIPDKFQLPGGGGK